MADRETESYYLLLWTHNDVNLRRFAIYNVLFLGLFYRFRCKVYIYDIAYDDINVYEINNTIIPDQMLSYIL